MLLNTGWGDLLSVQGGPGGNPRPAGPPCAPGPSSGLPRLPQHLLPAAAVPDRPLQPGQCRPPAKGTAKGYGLLSRGFKIPSKLQHLEPANPSSMSLMLAFCTVLLLLAVACPVEVRPMRWRRWTLPSTWQRCGRRTPATERLPWAPSVAMQEARSGRAWSCAGPSRPCTASRLQVRTLLGHGSSPPAEQCLLHAARQTNLHGLLYGGPASSISA